MLIQYVCKFSNDAYLVNYSVSLPTQQLMSSKNGITLKNQEKPEIEPMTLVYKASGLTVNQYATEDH